jgi:hypothetical protein
MHTSAPFSFVKRSLLAGVIFCLTGFGISNTANAAEQVVFRYQSLRESLTVQELSAFAKTGKTTPKMDLYLQLSRTNPKEIRQALSNEITVNQQQVEQFLNSWVGKLTLDEISQIVRPSSSQSSKKALRTAIARSTQSDNKFSLLEIFQNYPTTAVEIDIDRLIETDKRINTP